MATVYIILTCTGMQLVTASTMDVAHSRPASMSSSRAVVYNASTAVDRNTDAGGWTADKIIDTGTGNPFAWWKVDLQRQVQDALVRIYFRTDYKWRRNGVELYTSTSPFPDLNASGQGQLCHTVTGDPSGSDIPDVYSVRCPGRWRYFLLYTDTDNDGYGPVLDFGEVEVYACSNGTYGEDCKKTCSSRNCATTTTTCERDGGCHCGCQSGWIGVDCTQECEPGTYGNNCSLSCTDRRCSVQSSECGHLTGQCEGGCQVGYQGTDCTKVCSNDTYGPGCTKKCGKCDGVCDSVDGRCPAGCLDGYNGTKCDVAQTGADANIKEPFYFGVASLAGSVVGTFLLVVLLGVGIIICLIRQGR